MRLYRALLHLYPKSFRHEYGGEMAEIFRDRWRDAGVLSRLWLWCAAIPEIAANAALAHWELTRQDLRYAFRWLRASPGFTATALVVVALGIGANTAVFSVADFMLLRPLPFHEPGRLVNVMETTPGYSGMELSPANYRDWKRMNTVASAMGTYTTFSLNQSGHGAPERVEVGLVSADLFGVLGVSPLIGRDFVTGERRPRRARHGAPEPRLLAGAFWRRHEHRRSGADAQRRAVHRARRDAAGFRFPDSSIDVWVPQRFPEEAYLDRTDNFLIGVARLRPGVALEQAQADFARVAAVLEQQFPRENERTGAIVTWMRDDISSQPRSLILALGGAAVCVLLIVCANLANLLIARAHGPAPRAGRACRARRRTRAHRPAARHRESRARDRRRRARHGDRDGRRAAPDRARAERFADRASADDRPARARLCRRADDRDRSRLRADSGPAAGPRGRRRLARRRAGRQWRARAGAWRARRRRSRAVGGAARLVPACCCARFGRCSASIPASGRRASSRFGRICRGRGTKRPRRAWRSTTACSPTCARCRA